MCVQILVCTGPNTGLPRHGGLCRQAGMIVVKNFKLKKMIVVIIGTRGVVEAGPSVIMKPKSLLERPNSRQQPLHIKGRICLHYSTINPFAPRVQK